MAIHRSNKEKVQFAYGDNYGVENIKLNSIEETYTATDSLFWINVMNRMNHSLVHGKSASDERASNVDSADLIGCLINALSVVGVLAEVLVLLIQRIQSPRS